MRERPILFSAPMVRAILEGRKTQTRRVARTPPHPVHGHRLAAATCPYGQPGDRLWVRETWGPCDGGFCYRADEPEGSTAKPDDGRWHPSIHMLREASRITLEVTGVRVERLQSISDDDAIAEGLERHAQSPLWKRGPLSTDQNIVDWTGFPLLAFRSIWEAINGAESWAANPWVWVVEFRRVPQ